MNEGLLPPPPPGSSEPSSGPASEQSTNRGLIAVLIVAVVLLVGVGAFFMFSGEGGSSSSDVSTAPVSTVGESASTTVAPANATPTNAPTATATTVVAASSTTVPPRLWGEDWTYFSVPELTVDDIRGSGCGSGSGADVSIGDVYPDGVWFGALGSYGDTDFPVGAYGPLNRWDGDSLEIDGYCVYTGGLGEQKYLESDCATGEFECYASGDFWMENKSERFRTMPVAPDVLYEAGTNEYTPECRKDDRSGPFAAWRFNPVWIVVQNGVVTEVHADCYFTP